ncbi:hypothetical protein [Nonomuraea sp. NPDC002799]
MRRTDWASLEHALGPAGDTPGALADLLTGTPEAQAEAVGHLNDPVHHQNTLYSATAPAALYVAAAYRAMAVDVLGAWGEEPVPLAEQAAGGRTPWTAEDFSSEPPF